MKPTQVSEMEKEVQRIIKTLQDEADLPSTLDTRRAGHVIALLRAALDELEVLGARSACEPVSTLAARA